MKTSVAKNIMTKGLLLTAFCCLAVQHVSAQAASEAETALKLYEEGINAADPAKAKGFLENSAFMNDLSALNPEKAAELTAKARAISELEELLDKNWRAEQESELSLALSLRIDYGRPLEKVGIGAAPETLLPWVAKYKNYSARKVQLIKQAIRDFDTVFGPDATDGRNEWSAATIRERQTFLAAKAQRVLEQTIAVAKLTDKFYQDRLKSLGVFKYLDAAGKARYERYLAQMDAAEAAKPRLTTPQLDTLKDQPIEQQMYILGGLFDKSAVKGTVLLERKVDGMRQSAPGETLSFQNTQLLAGMLRTALPKEIKGTVAGDKVRKFYDSGVKLEVAIESCQGCYAKYEPSTGRIVLDSEMVRQYLRVNDMSAETLMRDKKQVAALAKYISPIFVHEAAHQMQHGWADKAGIYKPYVQEDEIESNSLEALYTIEKLKGDGEFKAMFSRMRGSSTYAAQRLKIAQRFNKNPDDFGETVRRLYYTGLPSFDAAAAQILLTVSSELELRKSMSVDELSALERDGIGLKEVMGMTTQELSGAAPQIQTAALKKLQADLLQRSAYTGRYSGAETWSETALGTVTASGAARTSVPVL